MKFIGYGYVLNWDGGYEPVVTFNKSKYLEDLLKSVEFYQKEFTTVVLEKKLVASASDLNGFCRSLVNRDLSIVTTSFTDPSGNYENTYTCIACFAQLQ